MEKRWVENRAVDDHIITQLADQLNITSIIATLLVNRGVSNFKEAEAFFRPKAEHIHDPFLMKDMDKAIERIQIAIKENERILIYGDYDVDGTTSVSLVYSFFKPIYSNIDFYIPDRYKEGYGVSVTGIDYAKDNNCSLIIALDCGIKSIEHVDYAKSLGIDFIICDHHLPGSEIPQAYAVLDPKRIDCEYPFKELSGCGIGFKLVQAYCQVENIPLENILKLLDLVVVSIASDIVPVTGENRTLAYLGLEYLNSSPRPGLKALIEKTDCKELSINEIVFFIGPRINAAGRIDHAQHAVALLIAETYEEAKRLCEIVDVKNTERKEFDQSITLEAIELLENDIELRNKKSTVLFNCEWHKGVIGIVASRLIDKYYRPTIILTESNGHAAGSARSVNGFDIYEAISSCSDLLEQYGGHKYAAGLTMKIENIPAFIERFEEIVSNTIHVNSLQQEIEIEAELNLIEFNAKFYRILKQFAPFGPGNSKPVFISSNVQLAGDLRVVGKQASNHLKFSIVQNGSYVFECIAYGLGHYYEKLQDVQSFDICYSIEENTWRDKTSIQLNVKDIRVK
ncbi:MAG: single-stranded-DNA-specific exonuclease RecJ [bacterium]|jgi:single-stranded-DNA-specific exonuclease